MSRYLAFLIVAAAVYHSLSYARYCWGRGNRTAAAGALLMALLALVLPIIAVVVADLR